MNTTYPPNSSATRQGDLLRIARQADLVMLLTLAASTLAALAIGQ